MDGMTLGHNYGAWSFVLSVLSVSQILFLGYLFDVCTLGADGVTEICYIVED